MQFKHLVFGFAQIVAVLAVDATTGTQVLTLERVYHTIINEAPFLVDRTSTVIWTQTPTTTPDTATAAPTPSVAF